MSKLNDVTRTSSYCLDVGIDGKRKDEGIEREEGKKEKNALVLGVAEDVDKKMTKSEDVFRFTMLFNKYNCDLDVKRSSRNDEEEKLKYTMFFNKEVTIRANSELPPPSKIVESKKSAPLEKVSGTYNQDCGGPEPPLRNHSRAKCCPHLFVPPDWQGKPQISEPEMMFSHSLNLSSPELFQWTSQSKAENLKKILSRKNGNDAGVQLNVRPATQTDLRSHNSLTSLSKSYAVGPKGVLKSKIPSLTSLESSAKKSGYSRIGFMDHWEDLILMQSDRDKKFDLQISRSSNDNNQRSASKLKKEDAASVSDSKLLVADSDSKKQIKKNDKKSRGDSSKKERDGGSRKQVQWKTEVDVIYFSTHLAANGDRSGEVIGRVIEPLREEWEQQRKGFYAKMVPSYMESHIKDRFISLLKI